MEFNKKITEKAGKWWYLLSNKGILCFKYFEHYYYIRLDIYQIAEIYLKEQYQVKDLNLFLNDLKTEKQIKEYDYQFRELYHLKNNFSKNALLMQLTSSQQNLFEKKLNTAIMKIEKDIHKLRLDMQKSTKSYKDFI